MQNRSRPHQLQHTVLSRLSNDQVLGTWKFSMSSANSFNHCWRKFHLLLGYSMGVKYGSMRCRCVQVCPKQLASLQGVHVA